MNQPFQTVIVCAVLILSATPGDARTPVSLPEVLRLTLLSSSPIKNSREEVGRAKGQLQEASGGFDRSDSASLSFSSLEESSLSEENSRLTQKYLKHNLTAGSEKRFRSGILTAAEITVEGSRERSGDEEQQGRGSLLLKIDFPLWRGRGREAVTADERAAEFAVRQAEYKLLDTITGQLRQSTDAFRDYQAARRRLAVMRESEQRIRQYLDDVLHLVEAGERAAADLLPLHAQAADSRARRILAAKELSIKKNALGEAMGVSAAELAAMEFADEPWPEFTLPDKERYVEEMTALALSRRKDLAAARAGKDAAGIMLAGAKDGCSPELNLYLQGQADGLSQGGDFSDSLHFDDTASLSGGIRFRRPAGNNGAEGIVTQKRHRFKQAEIKSSELERTIRLGVMEAVDNMFICKEMQKEAATAVREYEKSLEAEQKKMQLGMGTVLDLLAVQRDLEVASLQLLDSRADCAAALSALRFETASFMDGSNGSYRLQESAPPVLPGK
ncbi:MAG: hypothetical protein CSB24_02285 [Deltaproteobacteria bacterium]|nr:MAG: hypothetical protein CSB24_02285 [Deltaproteobacteria bacterium]